MTLLLIIVAVVFLFAAAVYDVPSARVSLGWAGMGFLALSMIVGRLP